MTGPRTPEGKAISSRNALTLGLYTRTDYVKPDERELYNQFRRDLLSELTPASLLEDVLASEIVSATWRLRRCSVAEADLEAWDDSTEKTRRGIDRARAAAHCALNRALNNLRKLQTERITREQLGLNNTQDAPLAESRKVCQAINVQLRTPASGSNCKTELSSPPQPSPLHRSPVFPPELSAF